MSKAGLHFLIFSISHIFTSFGRMRRQGIIRVVVVVPVAVVVVIVVATFCFSGIPIFWKIFKVNKAQIRTF